MKQKRNFFDRISWWWLLFILFILTFLSSIGHFILSLSDNNGLVVSPTRDLNFWDTLYYSFVVETTLGCGDIQAIGFSRLLTCVQVAAGLILAGITVAKITSRESRRLRYIRKHAEGYWLEPFRIDNTTDTMFTFTQIYYDKESGEIKYEGDNYLKNGQRNGGFDPFRAELVGSKDKTLIFMYENIKEQNLFAKGIMELSFCESKKGTDTVWDYHNSVCYDHKKGERTIFSGWRVKDNAIIKIFQNDDVEQKAKIIKEYIEKFEKNYSLKKVIKNKNKKEN